MTERWFFPMLQLKILLATAALLTATLAAQTPGDVALAGERSRATWMYFDAPLWDLADEGLPFRLTIALPSGRDFISRLLGAGEARWVFSAGYAKVYNSYDGETGVFKNPGGHAALLSAGRQMFWDLPAFAGRFTPRMALEYGVHVATRPFPADGTRGNLKGIIGVEWATPRANDDASWSAGVYWAHFSNANAFSRNAGYDGLVIRFGRSVRF